MSSNNTIDAVRIALGMQELQARVASMNIANAGKADARAMRVDFASVQAALSDVASAGPNDAGAVARLRQAAGDLRGLSPMATSHPINADEQVGDMVAAGVGYQTLSEALSRQFGLMRLAISGRS